MKRIKAIFLALLLSTGIWMAEAGGVPHAYANEGTPSEAATPAPTETPEATKAPTPSPEIEPTPAGTVAPAQLNNPQPVPPPQPSILEGVLAKTQDVEGMAKILVEIKPHETDTRSMEVLIRTITDDDINTIGAYFTRYSLGADAFDAANLLKIDAKDSKGRYAATIPYDTRYFMVLRMGGVELCYSGIFPGIPKGAPQEPENPDEPEEPEEPEEDWDEFAETNPTVSGIVYDNPKDEDMDGFYSRSEYRLGYNPALRDSTGTGYWDYVHCYMAGRLGMEAVTSTPSPEAVAALVQAGALEEGKGPETPEGAAGAMQKSWHAGGAAQIGWMNRATTQILCLNNKGLFLGNMRNGEEYTLEGALEMKHIGYIAFNRYNFARAFEVSGDGNLALIFDRVINKDTGREGGVLRDNAVLVDVRTMRAYSIKNTKDALGVALSPSGKYLAIWRKTSVEIWDIENAQVTLIDDEKRMERMEMLAFTEDDQLIVRVTQMGYNALLPDGTATLGSMESLGVFVRSRDFAGMSVYDKDHELFRVDAQLYFVRDGICITGEDKKTWRNFSPAYWRKDYAGE